MLREEESNFEIVFEWSILTISLVFVFMGIGGLIMVITSHRSGSDTLLEYAYTFIYSYMLVLGTILLVYRNKILVKR
jgi:hypothetical protein